VAAVAARARSHPTDVAMRRYQLGRWREHSWGDLAVSAAALSSALRALGVDTGDRVAVLSSNRPAWLEADLSVQSLGAITVGLDPAWPDTFVASVLARTGCGAIVVEDATQFRRAAEARSSCPRLARAVVIDDRHLSVEGDHLATWSAAIERAGASADPVADLEALAAALKSDAPAALIPPIPGHGEQDAVLSHGGLVAAGAALARTLELSPGDELVAHVSLADRRGRLATLAAPIVAGAVVNYGIGGVSLGADLRLAQPTVLFAETLVWEVMRSEVERRMGDASRLKRTAYGWARRSAARRGPSGAGRGRRLRAVLGDATLRRKLGLSRLRIGLTGDTALADDTARFYTGLGVHLVPLPMDDAAAAPPVAFADLDDPSSLEETRP